MPVFFGNHIKSDLSSVRYCTSVQCTLDKSLFTRYQKNAVMFNSSHYTICIMYRPYNCMFTITQLHSFALPSSVKVGFFAQINNYTNRVPKQMCIFQSAIAACIWENVSSSIKKSISSIGIGLTSKNIRFVTRQVSITYFIAADHEIISRAFLKRLLSSIEVNSIDLFNTRPVIPLNIGGFSWLE